MSDEQEYKPVPVMVIQPKMNVPAEPSYDAAEPVAPVEASMQQSPDYSVPGDETVAPSVGGERRRSKRPIIIVVLIVLAGVAGFVLLGGKKDSAEPVMPTVAPSTIAPSPETSASTDAKVACEKMLRDNATQSGADADAYVAQNQAWVQQCIQQKSGSQ